MKRLILCVFFFINAGLSGSYPDYTTLFDQYDSFKKTLTYRFNYYKPYMIGPTFGLSGFALSKQAGKITLGCAGLYGIYQLIAGYRTINTIAQKYHILQSAPDYWSGNEADNRFMLCRWRQLDDRYNDGYYWPTAWLMNDERARVEDLLIKDVRAQRMVLVAEDGSMCKNPTPNQVLEAIEKELEKLQSDKEILTCYTDVFRRVEQPEAFHPDHSSWRVFWFNYNRASYLYVEVVVMMKRLEVLQDIVASIKTQLGGGGWPRI